MAANNKYAVEYTEGARRDLKKLPKEAQLNIVKLADNLSIEPRPEGVEFLRKPKGTYRVRTGNYRVVYEVDDAGKIVIIAAIGDRKVVYKLAEQRYK